MKNKLLNQFKEIKQYKVGSACLDTMLEGITLELENNGLTPDKETVKALKKLGVKPENYADVYRQAVGIVFGYQTLDKEYALFNANPKNKLNVFLPQKVMAEACGSDAVQHRGKDSKIHQTIIEPSRKLIEYVFNVLSGRDLKEVKTNDYFQECDMKNLAKFMHACDLILSSDSLTIGNTDYVLTPEVKKAAKAGSLSLKYFVADSEKGLKK